MKRLFCLLGLIFSALVISAAEVPTGPAVGTIAPDFKVRNLVTGEEATLSSQHGKVVILTFWASWCGPCKRELPILEGAQRAVGKDKLVVLAVSYRDTEAALAAIKKPAANWQINIMKDHNEHVASLYSVSKIPHLFMIGLLRRLGQSGDTTPSVASLPSSAILGRSFDRFDEITDLVENVSDLTLDELVADINRALAAPLPQD